MWGAGLEHRSLVNAEKTSLRKRHSNYGDRETTPQFLTKKELIVAEKVGRSSPPGKAVKELLDRLMTDTADGQL